MDSRIERSFVFGVRVRDWNPLVLFLSFFLPRRSRYGVHTFTLSLRVFAYEWGSRSRYGALLLVFAGGLRTFALCGRLFKITDDWKRDAVYLWTVQTQYCSSLVRCSIIEGLAFPSGSVVPTLALRKI